MKGTSEDSQNLKITTKTTRPILIDKIIAGLGVQLICQHEQGFREVLW